VDHFLEVDYGEYETGWGAWDAEPPPSRACAAREISVERGGMGERGCARRLGGWVWV